MCRVSAVNPVLLLLFINEYNTWSPLISGKPAGTKSFVYVVYFGHLHFARHEHESVAAAAGRARWRTAKWLPHRMKILHTWAHVSLWNCWARRVDMLWRKCSFFDWSLSPSLSSRVVPRSDDRPSVTCTRMDCLTATHPHWLAGMKLICLLPLSRRNGFEKPLKHGELHNYFDKDG